MTERMSDERLGMLRGLEHLDHPWAVVDELIKGLTVERAAYNGKCAEVERLQEALKEIEKGEGEFSLDKYEHACNTIENVKAIARAALTDKEQDNEPI